MKWLLITNENKIEEGLSKKISNFDKKNKIITVDLCDDKKIKKIKEYKSFAASFVFFQNKNDFSINETSLISMICGILLANEIPLFSNSLFLTENPLFSKKDIFSFSSQDELFSLLDKKINLIIQDASKRLSKQKLLDRGIPFTSDCFATYIAKNKIEIVNDFLQAGMSVNSRDDVGTPMLNIAVRNDNFEFTQMLLDLGAELNASSEDRGYTAVMDAVWRGNEKITSFLIKKGADLNTISKEQQTNLILAVGANRENIVKLLAENGSNPDIKDMMGMSAYTYASLFKKEKLVEILKPYHKE